MARASHSARIDHSLIATAGRTKGEKRDFHARSCRPKFNGSFTFFFFVRPNFEATLCPLCPTGSSVCCCSFIHFVCDCSLCVAAAVARCGCSRQCRSQTAALWRSRQPLVTVPSFRNSSPVRRGAAHTCRWKAVDAGEVRAVVGSERTVGRLQRGAVSAIAAAAVRRLMRRRCSGTAGRSARAPINTQSERLHRAIRSRGGRYHSTNGQSALRLGPFWLRLARSLTLLCHSDPQSRLSACHLAFPPPKSSLHTRVDRPHLTQHIHLSQRSRPVARTRSHHGRELVLSLRSAGRGAQSAHKCSHRTVEHQEHAHRARR